jgi:hypothetical protein
MTHELPLAETSEQAYTPEALASKELNDFTFNPGLAEVATLFGAENLPEVPDEATSEQASEVRGKRLAALQKVATEHWDFRKGAERQAVDWNDELLDQPGSPQWDIVFNGAEELGQV